MFGFGFRSNANRDRARALLERMDSPGPGSQMVENDFYVKSVAENNAQSHFTYGMQGSGLTSGDASRETGAGRHPPAQSSSSVKAEKYEPKGWRDVMIEYTQASTFHGINKITENTPFALRRVIWVLLVLGGTALFAKQMSESIVRYLNWPVTVNIKINYNKTIRFPAVTICNQNVFRTTRATGHDKYNLISELYSKHHNDTIDFDKFQATNVTILDLYESLSHSKEDMIISCRWAGRKCNVEDFARRITDHGVCFTFNSNRLQALHATRTGSGNGLSLRLNVEQYEYMRGPNSAAGVKILVHDQLELPMVREIGLAIPTGSHAFIGLQIVQVNNLEPPYGKCKDGQKLQYFDEYSIPACLVDCLEKFVVARCGCRDAYMPELHSDHPKVCSLKQYHTCLKKAIELFRDRKHETHCVHSCPIPCKRTMFDATVTYGSMSQFDADRFLQTSFLETTQIVKVCVIVPSVAQPPCLTFPPLTGPFRRVTSDVFFTRYDVISGTANRIQSGYVAAREAIQRVNKYIVEKDENMVVAMETVEKEQENVFKAILAKMDYATKKVTEFRDKMKRKASFHSHFALLGADNVIKYGLAQAWDIANMEVFETLIVGKIELFQYIEKVVLGIQNLTVGSQIREKSMWDALEMLSQKQEVATRAQKELRILNTAFDSGVPPNKYNFIFNKRYEDSMVPKEFLAHFNHRDRVQIYNNMTRHLQVIQKRLEDIEKLLRALDSSGTFNWHQYRQLAASAGSELRAFNLLRLLFRDSIVYMAKEIIQKKENTFMAAVGKFLKEFSDLGLTIRQSNNLVADARGPWHKIVQSIKQSKRYLTDTSINKTEVSEMMTSQGVSDALQQMRVFFTDVRARARNFDHDWTKFASYYFKVWKSIQKEETTKNIYKHLHEDVVRAQADPHFRKSFWQLVDSFKSSAVRRGLSDFEDLSDFDQVADTLNSEVAQLSEDDMQKTRGVLDDIHKDSLIDEAVKEKDDSLFQALLAWKDSLVSFQAENRIGNQFLRDNLIEIDVFMKELHYQQIDQQVAYDLTNLWSDIGGSMGLFVGASVLTLFEILDAMIHNFLKIQLFKQSQKMKSKRQIYSDKNRDKRAVETLM